MDGDTSVELAERTAGSLRSLARTALGMTEDSVREIVSYVPIANPPEDDAERRMVASAGVAELRRRGDALLAMSADVNFDDDVHPAYSRILGELAPDRPGCCAISPSTARNRRWTCERTAPSASVPNSSPATCRRSRSRPASATRTHRLLHRQPQAARPRRAVPRPRRAEPLHGARGATGGRRSPCQGRARTEDRAEELAADRFRNRLLQDLLHSRSARTPVTPGGDNAPPKPTDEYAVTRTNSARVDIWTWKPCTRSVG